MRILVTGACGFIGSHLVDYLVQAEHEVVALDRLDETAAMGWIAGACPMVWHDLRAPIGRSLALKELWKPFDWVLHLAASSHVDRSVADPIGFLQDNVLGTANLLQWARETQPGKLLYFSTDEVFGPAKQGVRFWADERFRALNPYAASKAAAEALIPAWASTYGLRLVVSHCTNVYGPRQYHEKLIPLVVRQTRNHDVIQVHCRDGVEASRKFVHVYDVCSAVDTIMSRGGIVAGESSGRYNISGRAELKVGDVVSAIGDIMHLSQIVEHVEDPPGRPRPDMRYDLDDSGTRAIGWAQRIPFSQGLAETVEWYLRYDEAAEGQ
jgi:dTDP-glucose 4,6-dehydratase